MDVYRCPLCTERVLCLLSAPGCVGVSLEGTNFRERRKGEVRRIPLPRTPVNKGKRRAGATLSPGPSLCERTSPIGQPVWPSPAVETPTPQARRAWFGRTQTYCHRGR